MKQIALFDMDGTLIDSGLDITLSINHVRERCYGLEPLSVECVIDAINAKERNLSEIFYSRSVYEDHAKAAFEEHYYEQCIQNVTLYEGVADVLSDLKEHRFKMGVATNAPSVFAKRMLEHLGVSHFFDQIIGADDVESPKPHPQMLHHHLNFHGFVSGTDRAWMIGDNTKDMEAARQAGIIGIFAGWGFSAEGSGDHFASTPQSLMDIICTKGKS